MQQRHLFLCGFRGSGKTSVARLLGETYELPVVDLDEVVQTDAGRTIREIFDEGGEQVFRDFETVALGTIAQGPTAVIALGGGAILREKNREIIRSGGHVVWLDAPADVIAVRIQGDAASRQQRPPLTALPAEVEIETTLAQRRPLYEAVADHRVATDGLSVRQVAQKIQTLWSPTDTDADPLPESFAG